MQPGFSGYRKRAPSPAHGSSAKRTLGGRCRSPSANSQRGFRKWESYPCPLVIGGCLSLHGQVWSDKGTDPWVVEVVLWGFCIPFRVVLTLSEEPIPYPLYGPSSIRGKALDAEVLSGQEGSNRACSSSVSGLLQPVICDDEGLRVLETVYQLFIVEPEEFSRHLSRWRLSSQFFSRFRGATGWCFWT